MHAVYSYCSPTSAPDHMQPTEAVATIDNFQTVGEACIFLEISVPQYSVFLNLVTLTQNERQRVLLSLMAQHPMFVGIFKTLLRLGGGCSALGGRAAYHVDCACFIFTECKKQVVIFNVGKRYNNLLTGQTSYKKILYLERSAVNQWSTTRRTLLAKE